MKNAEYEVIQRVASAGVNIGAEIFIIDNDGYPLWASDRVVSKTSPRVTADHCDFMISLHFESPKLIDIPSYAALWNPPEFYGVFGYNASVEKLATHDDVLSCSSAAADAHALNLFEGYGHPLPLPLPTLYHSLPGPFLDPKIGSDARLFYVGINWERITGQKGRHHELLEQLDKADLIDIYGPEEFHGVEPWEGFINYRGSIPFDGRSILADINKAGVCLAFSSEAHQNSGIMSNRLFEGLAAGAAIIANPHPFIDRFFADCVYVVDDSKSPHDLVREVVDVLTEIRRDPSEALRRARLGQKRFKEQFALERSLESLFDIHRERSERRDAMRLGAMAAIDVLVAYDGLDGAAVIEMVRNAARQRGVTVHIVVVCDRRLFESYADQIAEAAKGAASLRSVLDDLFAGTNSFTASPKRCAPLGRLLSTALSGLNAPLFSVVGPGEQWFSDHLAKLAGALTRDQIALVAVSGSVVESPADGGKVRRRLETTIFGETWKILHAVEVPQAGRFLFRASLLSRMPGQLIGCLDGFEHRALVLWALLEGPLVQSAAASHVRQDHAPGFGGGFLKEGLQVDMIMDSVRNNVAWARLLPRTRIPPVEPSSLLATAKGTAMRIQANRAYLTRKGRDGLALLGDGFSYPEDDRTWIDGQTATVAFALPEIMNVAQQVLILTVGGRKSKRKAADQVLTLRINRRIVLDKVLVLEGEQRIEAPLADCDFLEDGDRVSLEFQLSHADRVYDRQGRVTDPRKLGLWLGGLEIEMRGDGGEVPTLAPNTSYATVIDGDGADLLGFGFSPSEEGRTWIDGQTARLRFRLPEDVDPAQLTVSLNVGGLPAGSSGKTQICSITVNGELVCDGVPVHDYEQKLDVSLDCCANLKAGEVVRIDLTLRYAHQIVDGSGRVIDARRLGLWISAVELLEA